MITQKTILGIPLSYVVVSTNTHDISSMFSVGGTVASMAKQFKADAAINFNYANTDDGIPIGRVIHEGKVVISDIPKTIPREELYMSADGSLHIGKAPVGSKWALEGSPRLIHSGKDITQESVKRDQLSSDVWSRPTYRTAVGLRDSKTLVVVRTRKEIELSTLVDIMFQLGCKDALNGDGGGSSYFFPEDSGWGRKLGSGLMIKTKTSGDETKVKKLIALCDGHGMETAGKRTPIGIDDKETGSNFMHENEFNRSVVKFLDIHLKRCGFDTLLVAPTDVDTPLSDRTNLANSKNSDFYLSVHANAFGNGEWNNTRGIETFHYTKASEASKKYASIIHKYLIGGTKLPDRGVKSADFYVLKETKMPAVLVECAFMTSKEDAALLLTEAYRKECAEELAKAICEMFGVSYVVESKGNQEPITPTPLDGKITPVEIDLISGDKKETVRGLVQDGVSYVEARKVSDFMGTEISWNGLSKRVSIVRKN